MDRFLCCAGNSVTPYSINPARPYQPSSCRACLVAVAGRGSSPARPGSWDRRAVGRCARGGGDPRPRAPSSRRRGRRATRRPRRHRTVVTPRQMRPGDYRGPHRHGLFSATGTMPRSYVAVRSGRAHERRSRPRYRFAAPTAAVVHRPAALSRSLPLNCDPALDIAVR